jgi:hypothetical protein
MSSHHKMRVVEIKRDNIPGDGWRWEERRWRVQGVGMACRFRTAPPRLRRGLREKPAAPKRGGGRRPLPA